MTVERRRGEGVETVKEESARERTQEVVKKIETVVFLPSTPRSVLKKKLQEMDRKMTFKKIGKWRIFVVLE